MTIKEFKEIVKEWPDDAILTRAGVNAMPFECHVIPYISRDEDKYTDKNGEIKKGKIIML